MPYQHLKLHMTRVGKLSLWGSEGGFSVIKTNRMKCTLHACETPCEARTFRAADCFLVLGILCSGGTGLSASMM